MPPKKKLKDSTPSKKIGDGGEVCGAEKLKKMGVKVIENVDKSGFMKAAAPIQDQLAAELGPHAVKILKLVREVK